MKEKSCEKNKLIKKTHDKTEIFMTRTIAIYLYRHLKKFEWLNLDDDFFEVLGKGSSFKDLFMEVLARYDEQDFEYFDILEFFDEKGLGQLLKEIPAPLQKALLREFLNTLKNYISELNYTGKSDLEKNLERLKTMFNLTDSEVDFCLFLYLSLVNREIEKFFVDELKSHRLNGRKYLANILGITKSQLNKVFSGTLRKIEFYELYSHTLELNDDFLFVFEEPMTEIVTEKFFSRMTGKYHSIGISLWC